LSGWPPGKLNWISVSRAARVGAVADQFLAGRHLWDGRCRPYKVLAFDGAAGGNEAFRPLVLAWIIESTSKQDSLWVLEETGVAPVSYPTQNRRLPVFAKPASRQALSIACAAHAQSDLAFLVLYDVTTLHVETDAGDRFPMGWC
jgi:hypothetical protein